MKKNLLGILMLAGILFATSCAPEAVEGPTLQLSETGVVTLPKSASEKAITITTNQTEWTSTSNVDWVELVQSDKTLTIKTGENFTCDKRKAEVTVIAGGIGKKLAVEQSESELTIVTIPDKLEVNQWGGNFQFDVDANSDDWNVSSNAEWLKATPKQHKKEIALAIEENTSRESRTAILTISREGNTNLKEITIVQNAAMYFIMPYLKIENYFGKILEFENARKSTYLFDMSAGFFNIHTFITQSPIFPKTRYTFVDGSLTIIQLIASSKEIFEDPEFEKMMLEEGFDHPLESYYSKIITHGEKKYKINGTIYEDMPNVVNFDFTPIQAKPMPTFDELPYGFMDFGAPNGTLENVHKWESENGGVYNSKESDLTAGLYCFDAPSPWLIRAYFFENRTYLYHNIHIFPDVTKFFFIEDEFVFLTEEFTALKDKEGFTDYITSTPSGHAFFGSPDNPYVLGISLKYYIGINDNNMVVDLRFFKAEDLEGSGVSRDFQRKRKLKDIKPEYLLPNSIF